MKEQLNELRRLKSNKIILEECIPRYKSAAESGKTPKSNLPVDNTAQTRFVDLSERADELEMELIITKSRIKQLEPIARRYIDGIEDIINREIVHLWCIECAPTWESVAQVVGGYNNANSVRKRFERTVESCPPATAYPIV